MRQVLLSAVIVGTCLISQESNADFAIKNNTQVVSSSTQASPSGGVADYPPVDLDHARIAGHTTSTKRPPSTMGFGDQVPLSFACRQIVPQGIRVAFGPGASPDALVDWKGGDPWPLVLARAIRPLGLHMVAVGTKLTIKY